MNRIVMLILVIVLLCGAGYYAYSKYKALQPPPRDPNEMQMFPPMGVPAPPMMPAPPAQNP